MLGSDHNAVIYDGSHNITAGMFSAAPLCDSIGFRLDVDPPSEVYYQTWVRSALALK